MPFPRSVRLFTYGKEVGGACFRTGCSVCPYAGAEPGPHFYLLDLCFGTVIWNGTSTACSST